MYVSSFKNNLIAKRSKIIFSRLIDYFSVVIISFIFFACCTSLINSSLPYVKEAYSGITTLNTELKKVVGETRIQEYDEESNSLKDISVSSEKYITCLTKTSLYIYGEKYPVLNELTKEYDLNEISKDETFLNQGEIDQKGNYNYPNDNLSYFFLTFKSENESLNDYIVDKVDYSSKKEEYLYTKMLGYENQTIQKYFIDEPSYNSFSNKGDLSRYNILNKKTSEALKNYLVYSDSTSKTIYSYLSNCFYNASSLGVKQVENNYSEYIELNNKFMPSYNIYVLSLVLSYIFAFLLGFSVVYVVNPLLSKKKVTLGMKVFKLAVVRTDEMEMRWNNNTAELIMLFLTDFSSIIFSLFFLNQLSISTYAYGGSINLFQFIIFSLGLDVISLVIFFINKNHQLLSNFAPLSVIKDTEAFEEAVISDEKLEEGKKDGR